MRYETSARITSFANFKGGSGKTTTAVNLAAALAHGVGGRPPQRVLLVDLEPLHTASTWLAVSAEGLVERSSAMLFEDPAEVQDRIQGLVRTAPGEGVDVIPAHMGGLSVADDVRGREFDLKDNLARLSHAYDHIFLDLPGSRNARLVRSALTASEGVVVPVQPGSAAVVSTMPFFRLVEEIRRGANPGLQVDGMVLSDAGARRDVDADVVHRVLQRSFPYPVFETHLRTLKAIQRSSTFQVSVFKMRDASEAKNDFTGLVDEWLERVNLSRGVVAHG